MPEPTWKDLARHMLRMRDRHGYPFTQHLRTNSKRYLLFGGYYGALLTFTVLFQWWTACAAIAGFVFGVFVRDFVWLRGINKTWPFNLEIMDWPKVERLAGKDPVD